MWLFGETAERIPNARLCLYQDKGHAGVMTHKPAIREIVDFLRGDDQAGTDQEDRLATSQ
jgi:hypothetical protein